MKRKAVTLQLEGEIPQPQSAYDAAVEDGYEGSEEQYAKELATIPPTQEQFDAIPGRVCKLTTTTEKSDFHHITDSAAGKVVEFGMEGKTEQETTSGKNLFDVDDFKANTEFTPIGSYKCYKLNTISGQVYTFNRNNSDGYNVEGLNSVIIIDGSGNRIVMLIDKWTSSNNKSNVTFTAVDEVYLGFTAGLEINLIKELFDTYFINPQLEPGSTATDYEPYTNGPSPNPDYPQEIVNAGVYNEATGRYEIGCKVFARNKFDKNNVSDGMINGDGTVTPTTSIKVTDFIKVNGGIKYYCSATGSGRFYYFGKNKQPVEGSVNASNGALFTTPTDAEYVRFCVDKEYVDTVILCESPVTIPYEPYTEQPFTLTSPVPLTKWDKLVKRDGVWGWSVNSVKVVTDGTGEWIYNEGLECFYLSCLPESVYNREGFCNQYVVKTSFIYSDRNFIRLGNNNKIVMVCRNSFMDSTLEDKGLANFKAHLAEHPLEIITYADEEQSFHPLPDEEQTLLNNLETYYGVTNLYNDQGCPMWLTYVQDTKTAIDNKFNNIRQAVLSLGGNV